jgi:hypothetical protein
MRSPGRARRRQAGKVATGIGCGTGGAPDGRVGEAGAGSVTVRQASGGSDLTGCGLKRR